MVKPVPDGYHTLTPYLTVPDGERMLSFLQDVFGAKLVERHNRPDGTLQHAELQIGDSKIMVGGANQQIKGGRHLKYDGDSSANLLVSVTDKLQLPTDHVGQSTGKLDIDRLSVA